MFRGVLNTNTAVSSGSDNNAEVEKSADILNKNNQSPEGKGLLTCSLCLHSMRKPFLCSKCSQPACRECMETWVQDKHSCPFCRGYLTPSKLLPLLIYDDLMAALPRPLDVPCKEHPSLPRDVYCLVCKELVCAQCALFSPTHTKHEFMAQDEFVERTESMLRSLKGQLEERKALAESRRVKAKEFQRDARELGDRRRKEIHVLLNEFMIGLDQEEKRVLDRLESQEKALEEEAKYSEQVLSEINGWLECDKTSEKMIRHSEDVEASASRCIQKQLSASPFSPMLHQTLLTVAPVSWMPPFHIFSGPFPAFASPDAPFMYSPSFTIHGRRFRLKFYPFERMPSSPAEDHLSLFLEFVGNKNREEPVSIARSGTFEYEFTLESSSEDSSLSLKKRGISFFSQGERWGFSNLCSLETAKKRMLLNDGQVNVKVSVRAATGRQFLEDVVGYSKWLEASKGERFEESLKSIGLDK